jgi:chromate transporter
VHRIGSGALTERWLFALAVLAAAAELAGAHFAFALSFCGIVYVLVRQRRFAAALLIGLLIAGAATFFVVRANADLTPFGDQTRPRLPPSAAPPSPSVPAILGSGLQAGLLTFGGAYTAIPFVRKDAVERGRWLTDRQFLDGLALGGILPAPLIIFGTFVGYVAGGLTGALAMTLGIFLPAFAITLVGHEPLERIVENRSLHDLLDGITAGVVGLIAATSVHLFRAGIGTIGQFALFAAGLAVLYLWRSKAAIAVVVVGAALLGLLL